MCKPRFIEGKLLALSHTLVSARLAVGEEPRDRPGWGREERSSRECGGLSQTCDSPAVNSRVNLSVQASSCWGWRREDRQGPGPRPTAHGQQGSAPPALGFPATCWSSAPGGRSSGPAQDGASGSSLPWRQVAACTWSPLLRGSWHPSLAVAVRVDPLFP